jgi:hypothetical protein
MIKRIEFYIGQRSPVRGLTIAVLLDVAAWPMLGGIGFTYFSRRIMKAGVNIGRA